MYRFRADGVETGLPRPVCTRVRLYLDACCLNRLTDDQTQSRIRQEAEAVEHILQRTRGGSIQWISSDALAEEIQRNPGAERRLENATLLALAHETVEVNDHVAARAKQLPVAGYGVFDALHLACAEAGPSRCLAHHR